MIKFFLYEPFQPFASVIRLRSYGYEHYYSGEVDASIVTTHMMLQAWELGIGSCRIGAFNPQEISKAFGLPANEHPVAILPLGYPADGCRPSDRHAAYRPDDEMVRYK